MAQNACHVWRGRAALQQEAESQDGQRHDRRHADALQQGAGRGQKERREITRGPPF